MTNNKKIRFNDEIDLVILFFNMWNNKFKIISTAILMIILMYGYLIQKEPDKIIIKASAQIKPISTFDESNYKKYNHHISQSFHHEIKIFDFGSIDENETTELIFEKVKEDYSSFTPIDKNYLYTLFIDKLFEESYLENLIKRNELIKKNDYENAKKYEEAVSKLFSSIKFSLIEEGPGIINWYIKSEIDNKQDWEYLLNIIEKDTNLEIQKYLSRNINDLLSFQKLLKNYEVEDLENEVERFSGNPTYASLLEKKIINIKNNKNIERIEKIFANTPINQEQFYAAKISSKTSSYERIGKETNFESMIFLAGLFGLLLGMILVQVRYLFSKRKK